jgi:hypothetical protein
MDKKGKLEFDLAEAKYELDNNLSEQLELRSVERSLRREIENFERELENLDEEELEEEID